VADRMAATPMTLDDLESLSAILSDTFLCHSDKIARTYELGCVYM